MTWRIPSEWREAVAADGGPRFGALSPRLAWAAHAVPPGARVADVGTDHGWLADALLRAERAAHVHAIDESEAAAAGARRLLAEHLAAGRAAVVRGCGLDALERERVDCVVVAGLGDATVLSVLESARRREDPPPRFVVQPNLGAAAVREAFAWVGYGAADEAIVADRGRLFTLLAFDSRVPVRPLDDVARYVGPLIAERGSAALGAWLAVHRRWLADKVARTRACSDAEARAARARLAAVEAVTRRHGLEHPPSPSGVRADHPSLRAERLDFERDERELRLDVGELALERLDGP